MEAGVVGATVEAALDVASEDGAALAVGPAMEAMLVASKETVAVVEASVAKSVAVSTATVGGEVMVSVRQGALVVAAREQAPLAGMAKVEGSTGGGQGAAAVAMAAATEREAAAWVGLEVALMAVEVG